MFLDGHKINLTKMMTFLNELARIAILLTQRSHDTSPRIMTILVGSSFHRENWTGKILPGISVANDRRFTRRIGLLENRLPRVEKKLLGGHPYIGLLWRCLPRAKTPIFHGSALKFWQHWHKSWSNHYWQHGFSIRDVITDLFTNRQFFYHFNSTSSWQPKVRTLNTP